MTGMVSDSQLIEDIRYHFKNLDFIKGHWEPWEVFIAST